MDRRRKLLLVGLFLAFDVLLVLGVLAHVRQEPPESDVRAPAGSATPSESAEDVAQQDFDFKPAESRAVSMANDGTIMQARRGRCNGDNPGELTISTDGGESTTSSTTGLREILAVSAVSGSELRAVGADASCTLTRVLSIDGGTSWQVDVSDEVWFPARADDARVVTPAGPGDVGCTVTSLSQVGSTFGRATCTDGTVRGTGDGGRTWVTLGRLDNVRVASFSTFNTGYALAVFQGCAAQEMTTRDGGRSWSPGGCITGEPAQSIDANDLGLVALVDDQLYLSTDGGEEWAQPE